MVVMKSKQQDALGSATVTVEKPIHRLLVFTIPAPFHLCSPFPRCDALPRDSLHSPQSPQTWAMIRVPHPADPSNAAVIRIPVLRGACPGSLASLGVVGQRERDGKGKEEELNFPLGILPHAHLFFIAWFAESSSANGDLYSFPCSSSTAHA